MTMQLEFHRVDKMPCARRLLYMQANIAHIPTWTQFHQRENKNHVLAYMIPRMDAIIRIAVIAGEPSLGAEQLRTHQTCNR